MKDPVIQDFGVKVGGARKDLRGNITREDISNMTAEERLKLVRKDMVWPTPDYVSLVKDKGCTVKAAAMIKMLRDSFPSSPTFLPNASEETKAKAAQMFTSLLNAAMAVSQRGKTEAELAANFQTAPEAKEFLFDAQPGLNAAQKPTIILNPSKMFGEAVGAAFVDSHPVSMDIRAALRNFAGGTIDYATQRMFIRNANWPEGTSLAEGWLRKNDVSILPTPGGFGLARSERIRTDDYSIDRLKKLGFSDMIGKVYEKEEEATEAMNKVAEAVFAEKRLKTKQKREALLQRAIGKPIGDGTVVSQDRKGEDYREGAIATGPDYLAEFGLRGGEFGLWVNQEERQDVLNRGFDSFRDIATVFELPSSAISLGGELSVAFGSRGRGGNAAAHYEPGRRVINLTKPSGEGCLGHEWGHGLDHRLGMIASKMGMVEKYRDSSQANYLTNLILKKPQVGAAPSDEECLIRDFHGAMHSIYQNTGPQTKEEVLEEAEKHRSTALRGLMISTGHAAQQLRVKEAAPDRFEEFEKHVSAIRNPEKGNETESVSAGMAAIINMPEFRTSEVRNILDRYHVMALNSMRHRDEMRALPDDWKGPALPRKTNYKKACDLLDTERQDPYYSEPEEMFARTFEAVLTEGLKKRGMVNHFLVAGAEGEAFPRGRERERLTALFTPLIERLPTILPQVSLTQSDFKTRNLLHAQPAATVEKTTDAPLAPTATEEPEVEQEEAPRVLPPAPVPQCVKHSVQLDLFSF